MFERKRENYLIIKLTIKSSSMNKPFSTEQLLLPDIKRRSISYSFKKKGSFFYDSKSDMCYSQKIKKSLFPSLPGNFSIYPLILS